MRRLVYCHHQEQTEHKGEASCAYPITGSLKAKACDATTPVACRFGVSRGEAGECGADGQW